jgi:NitT/TauT family transport system permease protein
VSVATTARPQPGRHGFAKRSYLDNERLLLGLVGVFGFLLLWQVGSDSGTISARWFSSPTAILQAGILEVQKARFWTDVRASVSVLVMGYALAVLIGVPLGLAAGWFRRLQYVLDPWLNFFNSLPRIALLPILVIIFGVFGPGAKVAVIFLGSFFAIIIPTVQGVRTVDRKFIDVARSFKASEWLMFKSVVGPATVPFIITGLRLGVARALIGVVTAELYTQSEGLGVMIRRATDVFESDRALFAILIFTTTGILGVEAVRRLENRYSKWRVGEFRR